MHIAHLTGILILMVPSADEALRPSPHESSATSVRAASDVSRKAMLGELGYWDDGLCEMSYFRSVDVVYKQKREYTRVMLVNRQWMDRTSGVKANEDDRDVVPVFKLTITEEVPTENYNYRFLTTVFVNREDMTPFKMVTSSQEWCGTTFKHLRWLDEGMSMKSYSYFAGEGDHQWHDPGKPVPVEALFVIARNVSATNEQVELSLLPPMRSSHQVEPVAQKAVLVPEAVSSVSTLSGTYNARRVSVVWKGPPTGFVVQAEPPYRILRYRVGAARGELQHVEKRSYWDRRSRSAFYEPGKAP